MRGITEYFDEPQFQQLIEAFGDNLELKSV